MSAEGRERVRQAQIKRWAALRQSHQDHGPAIVEVEEEIHEGRCLKGSGGCGHKTLHCHKWQFDEIAKLCSEDHSNQFVLCAARFQERRWKEHGPHRKPQVQHRRGLSGMLYIIPNYQREYVWKDKEVHQLLEDIASRSMQGRHGNTLSALC